MKLVIKLVITTVRKYVKIYLHCMLAWVSTAKTAGITNELVKYACRVKKGDQDVAINKS